MIASLSITKTLVVKGVKLMTERYKKILTEKVKVSAKINNCHTKKSYIFLHNNDCETRYIDTLLYIDLLSINFNLLSVLYHYAYHQIRDFEINTSLTTIL